MIWLLPHHLTPYPISKLSLFLSLPVSRRSSYLTGEGGRGGGGAKSHDDEKAWSSINHSIFTDKKENYIFLIYREIQSGAVAKSYMRKGFLIYEEMRKYFPIYEEAVSHI